MPEWKALPQTLAGASVPTKEVFLPRLAKSATPWDMLTPLRGMELDPTLLALRKELLLNLEGERDSLLWRNSLYLP